MDTEERDYGRVMGKRRTADLSGADQKTMASTIASAFRGKAHKLPCGCVPGLGLCQEKSDLAERIRRAKRRAAVRGDRKPLEQAMAEARGHWAEGEKSGAA